MEVSDYKGQLYQEEDRLFVERREEIGKFVAKKTKRMEYKHTNREQRKKEAMRKREPPKSLLIFPQMIVICDRYADR